MMLILIAFMTQSAKKVLNLQNSHAFLDEEKYLEGSMKDRYPTSTRPQGPGTVMRISKYWN